MTDSHDTEEAGKYLKEAQDRIPLEGTTMSEEQELEYMKETMQEQGTQIRALTLGADKNLVAQVIFIMRDPDIAWWSKPTLIRIVRNQLKLSRYERRMKERELQGRYKFKNAWIDWDFTTGDVIRIMYAGGKVIIGITTGSAVIFTAQEFVGNIIRSGAITKLFERALGL